MKELTPSLSVHTPFYKLNKEQKQIVNKALKSEEKIFVINGPASTGKTTIALAILKKLHQKDPKSKILYLTHTHALFDFICSDMNSKMLNENIFFTTIHKAKHNMMKADYVFVDEAENLESDDYNFIMNIVQHGRLFLIRNYNLEFYYLSKNIKNNLKNTLQPPPSELVNAFRGSRSLNNIANFWINSQDICAHNIHDNPTNILQFSNIKREGEYIYTKAAQLCEKGEPTLIALPSHIAIHNFLKSLKIDGLPTKSAPAIQHNKVLYYRHINNILDTQQSLLHYLGNSVGQFDVSSIRPTIFLMTYQSAKGLSFKNVFLPFLTDEQFAIYRDPDILDKVLYSAMLSTRDNLFLSYHKSRPLDRIKQLIKNNLINNIDLRTERNIIEYTQSNSKQLKPKGGRIFKRGIGRNMIFK